MTTTARSSKPAPRRDESIVPPRLVARPSTRLDWRVLRDGLHSGAVNMARDHALARERRDGQAVLRLYGWARPTVSLGRHEPARERFSPEAAQRLGVDLVRRPTGGRSVLHDAELTYAVIVPLGWMGGVREAYSWINHALADALRSLGAPVALAEESATPSIDAGPCFQSPAGGEVTAAGRKLVGSAQARVDGALLQHGSILIEGDQSLLRKLAIRDADSASVPATLSELVGVVTREQVADAVEAALRDVFGGTWAADGFGPKEHAAAHRLERERYGTTEWTWRR